MKERISLTIEPELLAWIDGKVLDKTFANRSHAIEYLIRKRMDLG